MQGASVGYHAGGADELGIKARELFTAQLAPPRLAHQWGASCPTYWWCLAGSAGVSTPSYAVTFADELRLCGRPGGDYDMGGHGAIHFLRCANQCRGEVFPLLENGFEVLKNKV